MSCDPMTDPTIRDRVIAVNSALRELDVEVRGSNLACGFEDVSDQWDRFTDQFELTNGEIERPSAGEQVASILRADDWSPGSEFLETIASTVSHLGYSLDANEAQS